MGSHYRIRLRQRENRVELDANGDAVPDFVGVALDEQPFTRAQPGLYVATASVIDAQGNRQTASTVVRVLTASDLDAVLQSKWTALKSALRGGDISQALALLVARARPRYKEIFQALALGLPNVDTILLDMSFSELCGSEVAYEMKSFEIRFVLDTDGIWRLWVF